MKSRLKGSRAKQLATAVAAGFLMGAADVVPGVSGGTVAFILGIYGRLLASIQTGSGALAEFARLRPGPAINRLKAIEWWFMAPLLSGIVLAVLLLAAFVERQLDAHPVELAGLFLGFVVGGIAVAWRRLGRADRSHVFTVLIVGGGIFFLLGLADGVVEESVRQSTSVAWWAFFAAGMVAICAMILPGISGSLLLVIAGMYRPVLDALSSRDFASLALFIAGAVVGLALFAQMLHWALRRRHDAVMAALIGLMVGSLRVIWPWPDGINGMGLDIPEQAILPTVILAGAGAAVVLLIDWVGFRASRPSHAAPVREAGGTRLGMRSFGGHARRRSADSTLVDDQATGQRSD